MSNEGAYLSFKRAFDEQRCEIQRLYDRVAKLEEANAKVLTYVKQTGNLPLLDGETIKCQVTPDTRPQSNDVSINSIADVNPNLSAKSVFYSARMSERCGTPEISAIVGQQTKEVEKALNNLDLEPVKRMQILNQVQSNLSAILYSQLASADMGFRASPNALDINTSNPSYHTPFMNGSIAVSCGDEMTITGTQPLIKSPGPITEHRPNSSRDIFTTDPAGSRTPVNPTPPPPPDVQERRRQELYRTNLRMHTTMRDQTREATVNADLAEEPTPVGRSSIVPPFLQNLLPVPSPRTKSTFGSVPGSGDETHPSPISTLRALNAKEYTGTKNTREFICPCKSEATCPLNPAKRCRFANDSRVARGFTLLAAAFRGRFIRQLLATHKVFDLIRTVKDSAKLALSIHVERAASGSKINDQKSSEFGLQADRYGRFSNEELALESRLLAQLRGALVQLHDIFFSWPLTSQIELLNVSRSLPQRNRRPLGKSGIPLEDQHSSGAKSDSFADDWTARDHYDQRRRKPSGLRCSQTKANRRKMEKPGHSGSSSLTKLIDSVRRSWPDHPKTEHKKSYSISVSSLAALAYDDNLMVPEQLNPGLDGTLTPEPTRQSSHCATSQPDQPNTTGSVGVQGSQLTPLQYTPVRLYTPPLLDHLLQGTPVPNPRSPALHPQPGHASLFHLHQLLQRLQVERQTLNVSPETLVAFCPRFSRSQQRSTPVHLQKVKHTRRSGSESIIGTIKKRPYPCRVDPLKVKLRWMTKKHFGSNNHHASSQKPHMPYRSHEKSLSSPSLSGIQTSKLLQVYHSNRMLTVNPFVWVKSAVDRWCGRAMEGTSPNDQINRPIITDDRFPDSWVSDA